MNLFTRNSPYYHLLNAVAQLVETLSYIRKVADSIPDGVIEIFH